MLALTLLMFLVQWLREKGEDVLIEKINKRKCMKRIKAVIYLFDSCNYMLENYTDERI